MKLKFFSLFVILFNCCLGQNDTSIVYYAKDGHETTKDSSFAFIKFYKQNNGWHGKEYYTKKGILKSEGDYANKDVETPMGTFNNYDETGKLAATILWNNGKKLEATYYHKNGIKKSWVTFDDNGIKQQKGWDEAGKEIKNYIVMREARYRGGPEKWKRYLEKNLDANVAADSGAPPGEYKVELSFLVSPDGNTSNVKATSIPVKCKPCAGEAIRVIINSREWEPAIVHNEPVAYLAKQYIIFVVTEEKRKN